MAAYSDRFAELAAKGVADQEEFFLKSFIFALGENWKDVSHLANAFKKSVTELGEGKEDMNEAQAADFLQKNGRTRTAMQRREELRDVDLDGNNRTAFIEYLLLHYKVMILTEYQKRTGETLNVDLSEENDGRGVVGVGEQLLDELFTLPMGMDPKLEAAIEEFSQKKKARAKKMEDLGKKAEAGGVKGMAAKNELEQMNSQDTTEMNRMELTLEAARKKASKQSGTAALEAAKKAKEDEEKAKRAAGRGKLKNFAAMFEQGGAGGAPKIDPKEGRKKYARRASISNESGGKAPAAKVAPAQQPVSEEGNWKKGDAVQAYYAPDDAWYQAVIESSDANQVVVIFDGFTDKEYLTPDLVAALE